LVPQIASVVWQADVTLSRMVLEGDVELMVGTIGPRTGQRPSIEIHV
jgi:hypothetical protein